MGATLETNLRKTINLGLPLGERIATSAPRSVICVEAPQQIDMMTALRLLSTETTTVRIIVMSEPSLNRTLSLATGAKSSPATLPPAHVAAGVMAPALHTHRVRCFSLLSRHDQLHHGRTQVTEG
jgi:hypothetical protein